MSNPETKDKLLKAVELELLANKHKNEANLAVYLNNPVGIGEHPDIVEEVMTMIKNIAEAEDGLAVLRNNFKNRDK